MNGNAASRIERLRNILENIVGMFEANREAHVAGCDAGCELLLGRQLLMRGGGRMDGERARVADVGDMVEEFERVDELAPRLDPPLARSR